MPPSILKESSRDDAATSFSKFNDKPRVAFCEPSPPAVSIESKQETSEIPIKKKANLTIRPEEETRVVLALQKAAKKQATGSLFSVVVDISKNGTLDIGVKDLPENLLVVSLLKRGNGIPGAAEEAGKHHRCSNDESSDRIFILYYVIASTRYPFGRCYLRHKLHSHSRRLQDFNYRD